MLYTITVVSPEVEDFDLELQIESDATFADLKKLVHESCGWELAQVRPARESHSPAFYVCDEHWHRHKTIPEKSLEDDTMEEVELGDHLEDEGQRLIYLFDTDNARKLLLEVSRIAYGKHIDGPLCRRSHGTAPALATEPEEVTPALKSTAELLAELNAAALDDDDHDFEPNDDDLFDMDEIDMEGFDFTEDLG